MRQIRLLKLAVACGFVAFGLSACALNRSVITVAEPVGQQPTSGALAKITDVRDARQFSVNPNDPSLPSLGNAEEIANPAITSRAVARKRNSFGNALGDVTLSETASVAALVRASAKKALQERGYIVVEESSADYARALPLAIDVEQFWAWMQPGFTTLTFTFNSSLTMKGGVLVADPSLAKSQTVVNSAFGTESVWIDTVQKGVAAMVEQIKFHIKPAAGAPLVSQSDEIVTPARVPGS